MAKAARESFDISTRIPTRDMCVSSRPTTSVNARSSLLSFLSLSLSRLPERDHGCIEWENEVFSANRGFLVISIPRKYENAAKSDMRSSAELKSNSIP